MTGNTFDEARATSAPYRPTTRATRAVAACPECRLPLDGAATDLPEHHDCRSKRERGEAIRALRERVADLVHEGRSLDEIARATRVGKSTLEPMVKAVRR